MTTALVYSEEMKHYDFGPGHPFRGDRYASFIKLFEEMGGMDKGIDLIPPIPATDADLRLVHAAEYIEFIKKGPWDTWSSRAVGFVAADTPLSPGMDEAARIIVGAGIRAGELVATGRYSVAISIGGGMHHARPSHGAGFCIYNDVAICVRHLQQRHGIERILILDTDGHAGDGTCDIFYEDPQILFISLHQDPHTQYPGTGFPHQIGAGEGKGFSVNIPLPPRTAIAPFLYALEEVFCPLAHEFKPQIILRNGGSDPHFDDQLIELGITVEGFYRIGSAVRQTAQAVCDGKIVDMVGSGYNAQVLPYAWLALVLGVSGLALELRDPLPPPPWLNEKMGMAEVTRTIKEVKSYLAPFWNCFQRS
jgi:acetoin utilization protein AcuC